jgi:hypothetical protein
MGLSKARLITHLAIVGTYLGIVAILYCFDFSFVLFCFAIPWSVPLTVLSGLILHMTVDGENILNIGSIVGALLNSLLFLWFKNRS